MSGETFDILNSIFSGQKPLRRTNPKVGESEYYYVVPGQNDWTSLNDIETVDVPSADTPNPYLQSQNTVFGQPTQFAQNNMQANDGTSPMQNWQNTLIDGINQVKNTFNPISSGIAMGKAVDEYRKLHPLNMYDKYKHATVSCTGAQGGLLSAGATAFGSIGKEVGDIIEKSANLRQGIGPYKTYREILNDSWQDMKANIDGLAQGFTHPTANCESLMKQYYNPYNK
ncbi:MAG: hypothetical protein IJ660_06490 [Alphaproteobacteria bacterium]|nr:hypothetical protein [Alphaproteobacteria bacterium]